MYRKMGNMNNNHHGEKFVTFFHFFNFTIHCKFINIFNQLKSNY